MLFHEKFMDIQKPFMSSPRFSLKRTMSLGRLTKKSPITKGPNSEDSSSALMDRQQTGRHGSQMQSSQSHESLLTSPSSLHSVDLAAGDIQITPLHSSMLGQQHCFQVTSSAGSKYYSCSSAEERDKWIRHLQKSTQPNPELSHRTENSLKLWIQEAKNVSPKKRYFCELCLDKTVYARTSSKTKNELLFWGEMFEFNHLPEVEIITVNIYREPEKKKKKDKNALIGYVNIPVEDVSSRQFVERWYTASSATVGRANKDSRTDNPIIRVKARYRATDILPLHMYSKLTQYLESEYRQLVEELESVVSVKAKEEVATGLVHLLHKQGKVTHFLSDIVMAEVSKLENENLAFRGNSIATKAMEAYLKLVGDKYLQDTLGDFIKTLLETGDDCEVDPMKVSSSSALLKHKQCLNMYCEMAWFKIINSHSFFPTELKAVFASLRERCDTRSGLSEHLISASIFLRFLCPAILSPSLFQLTQELPHPTGARNLTLVAKTIQSLANFTKFGEKENYMTFLNEFVERELPAMKDFIQQISEVNEGDTTQDLDGFIDTGKELSQLHSLLTESLPKLPEASNEKLGELPSLLQDLTEALENPEKVVVAPTETKPEESKDNAADMSDSSVFLPASEGLTQSAEYSAFQPVYAGSALDNPYRNGTLPRGVSVEGGSVSAGSVSAEHSVYRSTLTTSVASCLATSTPIPGSERFGPAPSVTSPKLSEQEITYSWSKIVSAANAVSGDYVDLISFVDEGGTVQEEGHNSSTELGEASVEQVSTVGSSGYHTAGQYSQSSSPTESVDPPKHTSTLQTTLQQKPLSFANPLFGQLPSRFVSSQEAWRRKRLNQSPSTSSVSSSEDSSQPSQHSLSSHSRPAHDLIFTNGAFSVSPSEGGRVRTAQPPQDLLLQPPTNSAVLVSGAHKEDPILTTELSKSAEFSHLRRQQASHSPGEASRELTGQSPADPTSPRGVSSPQAAVRMGINTVQRRIHEQDIKKLECEQELTVLKQQLAETQAMLQDTQDRLLSEETKRNSIMSSWQQRLNQSEQRMQQQQQAKDKQMEEICSRLLTVEEDLRREQAELQGRLTDKELIIQQQEEKIQGLDAANNRLLCALGSLRDRYMPHNYITPTISLKEGEGLRSSSC